MFKVILKHLIYERCIDILFDAVERNFARRDETEEEKFLGMLSMYQKSGYKGPAISEANILSSPYIPHDEYV